MKKNAYWISPLGWTERKPKQSKSFSYSMKNIPPRGKYTYGKCFTLHKHWSMGFDQTFEVIL